MVGHTIKKQDKDNLLLWMTYPEVSHLLLKIIHQSNLKQDTQREKQCVHFIFDMI